MLERNEKINKRQGFFIQSGKMVEPLHITPTGRAKPVQVAICLEVGVSPSFAVFLFININIL